MRPIDGDALRDKLQNLADDEWNQSTPTTWAEAFDECADMVDDAPTIEPEPHWIKCSERLPEEDTDILVTYVDGEEARIIPVNYGRGTWFDCIFNSALDSLKVIAWMPLPEPYREGEG